MPRSRRPIGSSSASFGSFAMSSRDARGSRARPRRGGAGSRMHSCRPRSRCRHKSSISCSTRSWPSRRPTRMYANVRNARILARRVDEPLDLGRLGLHLRDHRPDRLVDQRDPDVFELAHSRKCGRIAARAPHEVRRRSERRADADYSTAVDALARLAEEPARSAIFLDIDGVARRSSWTRPTLRFPRGLASSSARCATGTASSRASRAGRPTPPARSWACPSFRMSASTASSSSPRRPSGGRAYARSRPTRRGRRRTSR